MPSQRDRLKSFVDTRLILYRMVKQATAIVAVVLVIKVFILDGIAVKGDQMVPSIVNGDRVLTLRFPYLPFMREHTSPSRGAPVFFSFPFEKKTGCLRVAGLAGDTVEVSGGEFKNSADTSLRIPFPDQFSLPGNEVLPSEFSPRDNIERFRVPAPGDTLALDSLGLYAYFGALSVIRQENPKSVFSFETTLSFNDTLVSRYVVTDFAFYKGHIDSIPDSSRYDWFFWNHFKEYIRQAHRDRKASLSFVFKKDGERLERYVVKKRFLFLLADNWNNGLDSRYFGPLAARSVIGRPVFVLWSIVKRGDRSHGLDTKRIGKIIR